MSPIAHVLISTGAGAALAYVSHSSEAGMACVIGGVLIDLDHHLDYFFAKKKIPWTLGQIRDYYDGEKAGKLFLLFHSYELLLILWLLYYFCGGDIFLGVLFGATGHLICDQFYNPLKPLSYFLFYRIQNGFEKKNLFNKEHYEKHF